jgi:hypothetical protein
VREALCDCELVRVVLGAKSEVIDVGSATRTVPEALRTALAERDRGCVFPSCGLPASACQAHHLWKHKNGCPTSLEGLALVCPTHHRLVEPSDKLADGTPWRPGLDDPWRWRIEIDPAHHHPVAIPPARVDPERRALMNDRIKTKLEQAGVIDSDGQLLEPPPASNARPARPPAETARTERPPESAEPAWPPAKTAGTERPPESAEPAWPPAKTARPERPPAEIARPERPPDSGGLSTSLDGRRLASPRRLGLGGLVAAGIEPGEATRSRTCG